MEKHNGKPPLNEHPLSEQTGNTPFSHPPGHHAPLHFHRITDDIDSPVCDSHGNWCSKLRYIFFNYLFKNSR